MRDAFGGAFMMRLLLVFIFIYVSFTAVSLNYAKAYRIKNKIIDVLEQEEVVDLEKFYSQGNGKGLKQIDTILQNANYTKTCTNNKNKKLYDKENKFNGICYNGIKITIGSKTKNYVTYNIYTYADWNLGGLNMLLGFGNKDPNSEKVVDGTWEITGQAKVKIR